MRWPVAIGKSRKRRRSKSPPIKIRGLKRRHDSSGIPGPLKPLRIFYRSLESESTKSFLLEISSHEVEFFSKVDYSSVIISYNHSSSSSFSSTAADEKFPPIRPLDSKYLCKISHLPDKIPFGNAVVIGSTVYACYYGRILTLDLHYKPPTRTLVNCLVKSHSLPLALLPMSTLAKSASTPSSSLFVTPFAFNCETLQLSQGHLVGMEHEYLSDLVDSRCGLY